MARPSAQIAARVGAEAAPAEASALEAALAAVVRGLCRVDPTAVLLQLLALRGAAEGRRQHQLSALLDALKDEMPRAHEAASSLADCCLRLAAAAAQGAATEQEVAALRALHQRVALSELRVPAAPRAEAALERLECGHEVKASDGLRHSRLLRGIDASGEAHPLLLKVRQPPRRPLCSRPSPHACTR